MSRMTLRGRAALITGAASGIGRALAVVLAGRGCHLALVDRDGEGLEKTRALCAGAGLVTVYTLDLGNADTVAVLPIPRE
jgi:NAD(P)-dependent dehydrogenase (short-subunit alcohol dehydrogenase family)